ncbi:ketopantoate reductase family protein [Amnibacterium setariae]|uniref:Ketopantoate reductase family protein n=1 Tax=Amnibacterium setariae TaxID=2306585 RepID=A0A3A1U2C7_9MICO|nr:2-dehydropantoate 2-reductase N-terminal domain-containing protein [Amnibacterium setariae]RIX31004.1 ketopantoate reductase family protein [Amnibacterium setariae]
MRYVVVGAGAVGGVIGGLLADAGREVALVARGPHGDAIARDGLVVRRPDRELRLRLPVAPTLEAIGLREDDAVLVAVKSQQTAGVLEQLAALRVGDRRATDVLPLLLAQNGVANEDAALRFGPHVHGVCVNLPATHLEPGVVIGEGAPVAGVLTVGRAEGGTDEVDHRAAEDLTAAGFRGRADEDVMAWKRAKLLRNVGNAVEALSGHDDEEGAARLDALARAEAEACFAAAGLAVVDDERYAADISGYSAQAVGGRGRAGGSTWQSVTRGQGTVETDWLNGEIARLGRLHGVPTPANALLQREMWRLLDEGGEPGSRRAADLLAALR